MSSNMLQNGGTNERLRAAFRSLLLSDANNEAECLAEIQSLLLSKDPPTKISLKESPVKSVKKVRRAEDEYVYDIGMANESKPWYFGNNILIHNSSYFSAWPAIRASVEAGEIEWNRDTAIQLYDGIAERVNESFAGFAEQAFRCPQSRGNVLKCGREIVASKGLYITKKRYAVLYYDKDGKRYDSETSPGKIKAMGLDLKRSDTPKQIQKFLMGLLHDVLTGSERDDIVSQVLEFKKEFKSQDPWMKGSPKRVNNMTSYGAKAKDDNYKGMIPGHVRGSLNWNTLRSMNSDNYTAKIVDGMKVIVCKLRPNPMGWTSIAYPTDEQHLPQWFKELPFDSDLMESTVVDQKVNNLLGVLDWGIMEATDISNTFQSLFEF